MCDLSENKAEAEVQMLRLKLLHSKMAAFFYDKYRTRTILDVLVKKGDGEIAVLLLFLRGKFFRSETARLTLKTDLNRLPFGLTDRSSRGRSPPLLMPLFMETKRSSVVLSFTQGLWRLVLSMMMANDRM